MIGEVALSLMLLTVIFAILIAIPLGVVAAWKHGSWIDRSVMMLAVFGFSTPAGATPMPESPNCTRNGLVTSAPSFRLMK